MALYHVNKRPKDDQSDDENKVITETVSLSPKLKYEYLVYGYVKEFTKSQNLDNDQIIPNEIKDTIINFYQVAPIIMDRGSRSFRAGFAGDKLPLLQFESVIGTPLTPINNKEVYIGEETKSKRSLLSLRYPIEYGYVNNWDDMETLWNYTFEKMECIPKGSRVLQSEMPFCPKSMAEKATQIMFETFQVSKYTQKMDAELALFAVGLSTGVVISCGDGVSHTVPIYQGSALQAGITRFDIAGKQCTEYLKRLMTVRGYEFDDHEIDIVNNIKEKLCYVALDFDEELVKYETMASEMEKSYKLPDGKVITIGNGMFRAPELLFKPTLMGHESEGIHKLVYYSIWKCDVHIRDELYGNVLCCGGGTMFDGFGERVKNYMVNIAPDSVSVNVIAPKNRNNLVWIGGSMLVESDAFCEDKMWITSEEYDEFGPVCIHRK